MSIELGVEEQKYIDRDLSWLSFNERVLMEATDPNVPLYERIRFLGIYSSNLDEYFRVRVAALRSVVDIDKKKINKQFETAPKTLLKKILKEVNRQQQEFGQIKKDEILPELKKNGIILYRNEPIKKEHKDYLTHYFKSKVLSYLQPVIISGEMAEPPFLENRALYLITELERKHDCDNCYGKVKIPTDHIERFVELPKIKDQYYFITIEDIIRENLGFIFSGYHIKRSYCIKLNRDADLNIEDEFSGNLVKKIRKQIKKRNLGVPSRFLYDSRMPAEMLSFLQNTYKLSNDDLVPGGVYHNMHDLMDLKNPVAPELEYNPQPAIPCSYIDNYSLIFEGIAKQDVMLHFPYHTYDYVLRFFNEAALDPHTTHIYVTFYRVAEESFISNALISAAKNGKKVTVFVEIKARFDEANNLKWAERMEDAGVNIIYSIPGLKVHAKVALVQRKEKKKSKLYGFYGTGNFNEKTAAIYADMALFTSDDKMNRELLQLFKYLSKPDKNDNISFNSLLVAQFNLQDFFIDLIEREIDNAKAGKDAHIILKLNNIQDEVMIDKLYEANQSGVKVDLIVRAICCLRPQVKGMSENINTIRIVDRYLEHTRIFYFYNNGKEEFYSGSADWMKRNLYRRIEVIFPIKDEPIREEIRKFLQIQLNDNVKASLLDKDLRNNKKEAGEEKVRAQVDFYKYLKRKEEKITNHS